MFHKHSVWKEQDELITTFSSSRVGSLSHNVSSFNLLLHEVFLPCLNKIDEKYNISTIPFYIVLSFLRFAPFLLRSLYH